MALNTEIDALLDAADGQSVTIDQLLVQVKQRYDSAEYPDEYPPFSTGNILASTSDWPDLHEYLAEPTNMPLETAWARMWAAEAGEDQGIMQLYMLQVIRIMNYNNRFNTALPNFSAKSLVLPARAYFSF